MGEKQNRPFQLSEPVAVTGAAQQDRQLVAYQLAAATGEDRRPPGEARTVLLAFLGGEPSDPTLTRNDAAADLCAAGPHRLRRGECNEAGRRREGPRVQWCRRNAPELGVPVSACECEPG